MRKFVGPRAGLRTCAAGPPFTCIPTFRPSAAADTPPAAPAAFRDHMYPVVCVCLPACVAPAAPGSMRPIAPKTTLKYEFESRAVGARAIRCWFPSGPSLIWFCLLPSALARPLGRTRALRVPYRRDTCVEGPPSCSLHSLLSTAFNSSYLRAAGWPSTQRIALRCPVRFAKEVLKSDLITCIRNRGAGDCPSPPRLTTDLNGFSQRIILPVPGWNRLLWLKFEGLNPADPRTCERARENQAAAILA